MATITEANALMTEVAGQSIATAISTMSATSVGNLSALTTTDKSSLVGAINELKSGLTSVSGKIPIRGSFTVHCSVGNNVFSRNTMDLVAGSIPQSPFNNCIMMIVNHGSNNVTNDTIQVDGSEAIIINAQIEQNITVTWLDISNIPIANN